MNIRFLFLVIVFLFVIGICFLSCKNKDKYKTVYQRNWSDLDQLPPDSGGEHRAVLGSEYPAANNGFYIYLPEGYREAPINYPAIVFLHGSGETGNSMEDPDVLALVLKNGPPMLIESGNWNPPVPFIVISPQTTEKVFWDGFDKIMDSLIKDYPIDTSRLYNTGLSMGGYMAWGYPAWLGDFANIAAAVPVCGSMWEFKKNPKLYSRNLAGFPIWAFHGELDSDVYASADREVVESVNQLNPEFPVKYTEFPGLKHEIWDIVYNSQLNTETDPEYDPFDRDIYTWMLQYRRIKK